MQETHVYRPPHPLPEGRSRETFKKNKNKKKNEETKRAPGKAPLTSSARCRVCSPAPPKFYLKKKIKKNKRKVGGNRKSLRWGYGGGGSVQPRGCAERWGNAAPPPPRGTHGQPPAGNGAREMHTHPPTPPRGGRAWAAANAPANGRCIQTFISALDTIEIN